MANLLGLVGIICGPGFWCGPVADLPGAKTRNLRLSGPGRKECGAVTPRAWKAIGGAVAGVVTGLVAWPVDGIGMISFPTGRRPPLCALGARRRASLPMEKRTMKIKRESIPFQPESRGCGGGVAHQL